MSGDSGASSSIILCKKSFSLDKYALANIVFTELFWRAPFFVFKSPVKVRHIIKAANKGNFSNRLGRVNKHSADMSQSDFIQRINKIITGAFFNKPAEGRFWHVGDLGYF